jgi:hypothetical protein
MSEPPFTRPEVKVPHWTRAQVWMVYAWVAFQNLYLSLIWAGSATSGVLLLIAWLQPAHHPRHIRNFSLGYFAALGLTFTLIFLFSYVIYYRYPDREIESRLRAVADSTGLQLDRRANALASDWIWTRFPSVSMDIQFTMGDWCWILTSARDPSKLLMVTHRARSSVVWRVYANYPEVALLALFWQVVPTDAAITDINAAELAALGLSVDRTADGVCLNARQVCRWRKGQFALDLITIGRVMSVLKLVGMRGP